jgi:photosystem II stability/assembly factor-like uncharacterized protein
VSAVPGDALARAVLAASLLSLVALATVPRVARAHGRETALGQIAFHPTDRDHIVIRTTWGFLTTRDGGTTWTWQCADAVFFDRASEDPSIALLPSRSLLAATFDGIARSDGLGCDWDVPSTAPADSFVTDVIRDPGDPRIAWAIQSPGARPDAVWRSDDEGASWAQVAEPDPAALTDRIRIAPGDPMRIYTSGVIPRTPTVPRRGVFLRSDDRGATWLVRDVELLEGELTIHVQVIDPADPDRVLARTVRRVTDELPERMILTEDGGTTWRTVHEMREIVGVAMSGDGSTVWVGGWDGGFSRSTDRGATFASLDAALRARCLAWRPGDTEAGELWVCTEGFARGSALSRSTDRGDTLEPIWRYTDIVDRSGCPATSDVGTMCPGLWPDVAYDLMLDGAVPPIDAGVFDAATSDGGVVAGGGGCTCRVAGASGAGRPTSLLLAGGALIAGGARSRARRRRRSGCASV